MEEAGRKAFGVKLKGLREGAQLTQKNAAQRAKLSAPYLAQLERGQRNPPSRAALTRLAETYNVTPQTLWDLAEYEEGSGRVPAITPERGEWAFQAATSDPEFTYGHRARQGPLTLDQKIWFVQLYEATTGRQLLTKEEAGLVSQEDEEQT